MSVMNMDLTLKNCNKRRGHVVLNIREHAQNLLRLKGSNTMQANGEVFNGNNIIIDDATGCCYRKEQFSSDSTLPIEYVIVDRRYSMEGICRLVSHAGFIVDECYCVRAGRFEKKLDRYDDHAKEIIVIAHKASPLSIMFQRKASIERCWK